MLLPSDSNRTIKELKLEDVALFHHVTGNSNRTIKELKFLGTFAFVIAPETPIAPLRNWNLPGDENGEVRAYNSNRTIKELKF